MSILSIDDMKCIGQLKATVILSYIVIVIR